MKVMALILLTLLTLSIGLSNGRTQKSSLMVTPNGWQSLPNVTNSTVIVASHGRRLIGFDESGCATDKHGHHDPDHGPNRSDTTAGGRAGPPGGRSNPMIGFDRIPVIDLNGTSYLLSDNIVPVSTLSGDIIYTTPQALISIPNNTSNTTNTSTSTSAATTKTPLERYRLRQDSPRKNFTTNGTLLNGDEKPRSGSNHSNSMMKKGIYSLTPPNRSSTTSNLTSPTSAGRQPSSTSPSSAKLPSSSLPNNPRMMSPDMTSSSRPEDPRMMFPDMTSSARLLSSNIAEDPPRISSDRIASTGNHFSEDPRLIIPDMTSPVILLSSNIAEDPQRMSSGMIPSAGNHFSEDPRMMFPDTISTSRWRSSNIAEDPQRISSDMIPSTEDPQVIFPDMTSPVILIDSNDPEDAGMLPTDLTSSVILISSDLPQDSQLISSSSDIAPSVILISSDIPVDPVMIPSDSMTAFMNPQQSSNVAPESRSMYLKDPSSSSSGRRQSSNDGTPGRPMFSESAPCACNNQKLTV